MYPGHAATSAASLIDSDAYVTLDVSNACICSCDTPPWYVVLDRSWPSTLSVNEFAVYFELSAGVISVVPVRGGLHV